MEESIPYCPKCSQPANYRAGPLNVANEGKLAAFCPPEYAERLLVVMQRHPQGKMAALIGKSRLIDLVLFGCLRFGASGTWIG